ncbi:MAG: hypothetical protein IPH13_18435 [Planctomycetes bacterium]|nr:hypothetical protein [Planctomycetota bacterium]MCC7169133.1 hypothetical protein [Planctomycetota bacterium]
MLLRSAFVILLASTVCAPRTTWAQAPATAPAKKSAGQTIPPEKVRELPIVALPDTLADESFELEIKLPAGFSLNPNLESMRTVARQEFERQEVPKGANATPRTQLWSYASETGTGVVVWVNEILLTPIASPDAFATKFDNERQAQGMTVNRIGEPKFFKARDAHVGFTFEREVGVKRGGPLERRELWGYVRAGAREVFVFVSAPLQDFQARADEYLAMFATIQLRESASAPITVSASDVTTPKEAPGFASPFTIGALVLCAAVGFMLLKLMKAPAEAT